MSTRNLALPLIEGAAHHGPLRQGYLLFKVPDLPDQDAGDVKKMPQAPCTPLGENDYLVSHQVARG